MHKSFYTFRHSTTLGIYWIAGLLLGILSAVDADPTVLSLMRLTATAQVSIVFVLIRCVLPFLFTAFAVLIQAPFILYAVAFVRCFSCGFVLWLIAAAFGSAAWLIGPMLHFSEMLNLGLLCVVLLRWRQVPFRRIKSELVFCLLVSAWIVVIDHFAVSPFLAELLNS
jgi:hypothetical protein